MDYVDLWIRVWNVLAILILLGIFILVICLAVRLQREKNNIHAYLYENLERISNIQRKINLCTNREELYAVKPWAIASAKNIYNEMVDISDTWGADEGQKVVQDIKRRLSIKEESLCEPQS